MNEYRHARQMEIARQEITHMTFSWLKILTEVDEDDMADVLREIVEDLETDG